MMSFRAAHPDGFPTRTLPFHEGLRTHREENLQRRRIMIRGAVQGVGFRPFLFRLAREERLSGFVQNTPEGVRLELEGRTETIDCFLSRLELESPPLSQIQGIAVSALPPAGSQDFRILESGEGENTALILPDIATCPDCLEDLFNPKNRRYRYPFTNCAICGPRYSILERLPYDRAHTSMAKFRMCEACRLEYEDPNDRRFHAEPIACPACGPSLELWNPEGAVLARQEEALRLAEAALREGQILALKGLGGFQFLVNALDDDAIGRLRKRKHREAKPFAVMVPDLRTARSLCDVSWFEERLLASPESPIVLIKTLKAPGGRRLSPHVAPGNPWLGLFLPYTPLHHLLLSDLGFPVVATSGNLSDEPMRIDNEDARDKLGAIADLFLVHDRLILRQVDDSILRVMGGREMVLRRARGYAPFPIRIGESLEPSLATGALLKNTIAIGIGNEVYLSQYIGDLESAEGLETFRNAIGTFRALKGFTPKRIGCDRHPDYPSTHYAKSSGLPVTEVQHHYAHVLACMAENEIGPPALGISWDGAGLGSDGEIWGGEFLQVGEHTATRVAHLRTFPLPGGDAAAREPRRSALGILYEIHGGSLFGADSLLPQGFGEREWPPLRRALERGINTPRTSSAGRLFDAAASILGIRQASHFESQAAMDLEFCGEEILTEEIYPFQVLEGEGSSWILDWAPAVLRLQEDCARGLSKDLISAKFHNTLAEMIVSIAQRVAIKEVVLTGGCFQNKLLTERTIDRLREEGFTPIWHRRVPPNDGGIALGQMVALARDERNR